MERQLCDAFQVELERGSTKEEAYFNLSRHFDCLPIPACEFPRYFKLLAKQRIPGNEIFKAVTSRYIVYTNAIFCWPCKYYNLNSYVPNQSRYTIGFNVKNYVMHDIILYDLLNGQATVLKQLNKKLFLTLKNTTAKLHPINFKYLLIEISTILPFSQNTGMFYLLSLDIDKGECQIVDEKMDVFGFLIFDELDSRRFVWIGGYPNANQTLRKFRFGRIKNDKINFEDAVVEIISEFRACYRLRGTILDGLSIDNSNVGSNSIINYWSTNFDNLNKNDVYLKFEMAERYLSNDFMSSVYAWSKEICYVYVEDYTKPTNIVAFNVQSGMHTQIQFGWVHIHNLQIDRDDEILTIQTNRAVYRLPVRKPESLYDFCMFQKRKKTIFAGIEKSDIFPIVKYV